MKKILLYSMLPFTNISAYVGVNGTEFTLCEGNHAVNADGSYEPGLDWMCKLPDTRTLDVHYANMCNLVREIYWNETDRFGVSPYAHPIRAPRDVPSGFYIHLWPKTATDTPRHSKCRM